MPPSSLKRRYEKLSRLLERLAASSMRGVPIVVEGRRDEEALRRLGIGGPVLRLKGTPESQRDLFDSLSAFPEAVILTDFDEQGKELAVKLLNEFTERGIRADVALWRQLEGLVGSEVKGVQDMAGYYAKLKSLVEADL